MRFEDFSPKQMQAMSWWSPSSNNRDRDAVICDGAVRSGKSLSLSVSFVLWSMDAFNKQSFAICGKTIGSLRRNVITPLLPILRGMGMRVKEQVSQNMLELSQNGKTNRYHLFGGRDEGSAALIQGVTLAGVLLDEVALMPRSFVEQALARCSVTRSKFFFNCNPEHPGHWFYREWIEKRREKNALYLHFTMADNPSLTDEVKARYQTLYTGAFYRRYVLGEWVAAHGAVYPMFSLARHVVDTVPPCDRYVISCDYGTVNPASFGLWGHCPEDGVWYRIKEYYHDSRQAGIQRTDEEYADALAALAGDLDVERVIADPSAASFIQCLRRRGRFAVTPAANAVLTGIRRVAAALSQDKLKIHAGCVDCIREFGLYRWNLEAPTDAPIKEHDHAMDDLRYFVTTVLEPEASPFAALAASRGSAV